MALEEALVNAVYHRSSEQREPIEVRVNPDGIEIVSYAGLDPSIKIKALQVGRIIARRYQNRRIGDFLKELDRPEGRCTGIPKIREAMRQNGSPPPRFETDKARTYFLVELPIHPDLHPDHGPLKVQDGVQDGVQGLTETEWRILRALKDGPKSTSDLASDLGHQAITGSLRRALARLEDWGMVALTIPEKPRSKHQK